MTVLGLGFTNFGGTWGKLDMCLCFGCGGVGGECVGGLGQGMGGYLLTYPLHPNVGHKATMSLLH